jgi:hypothetical protein
LIHAPQADIIDRQIKDGNALNGLKVTLPESQGRGPLSNTSPARLRSRATRSSWT